MFTNLSQRDLIMKAASGAYPTADAYFGNYYNDSKELKKAFTFDGVGANTSDTSLASTANGNYRNYVYGKQIWAQMNIRPTVFTALPRNQYVKSGYRIVMDFATPAVVPNSIAEPKSHIPDVKTPSITSLRIDPKVIVNDPVSMTLAQQALDGLDDTVNFDAMLELLQTEFSMRVNGQLLLNNYNVSNTYDPASADPDVQKLANYGYFVANASTLADPTGVPVAGIDNLVSGYTEYNTLGYSADAKGYAAVDLFNINRHSAASNLDAFVDCSAAGARSISVDLLDNAIQQIMPFWKDNAMDSKVIITGFDTVGRFQQLHYQFVRYMGFNNMQVTYNGIKTCPGDVAGFGVSQFKGIPIIPDYMTAKGQDALGAPSGISKLYVLDANTIHQAILIPPTFIQDKSYIPRRSLTDVATYYMSSENVCTKPRANAKIMNLM
jgi:hypothetical protein